MNSIISRYGTFLAIPPVLLIIGLIACNFNVTTKAEITLIQSDAETITAYLPAGVAAPDTLRIDVPGHAAQAYPVTAARPEESYVRLTCRGRLPGADTLLKSYIITGRRPIYRILLHQNLRSR